MSVTNYNPNKCKYKIGKLDNVVYLVNKDAIGSISIDNGAAYVVSAASATSIVCTNIALVEEESLDERYQFSHQLQFSVQGYMNVDGFNGKYYVIVKDKDDTYWLLNPIFPFKITYTYTIDALTNRTDFILSTISNMPLLMVNGFSSTYSKPCNGYNLCGVDILAINEKNYSVLSGNSVSYTNDGFKDIEFLKNTCVFTEEFDGTNVGHQVRFKIDFDSYKSSWHYNLLEFVDNKYAMVMQTKCGTNIACGFNHGLQPSYTINCSEDEINSIEITLKDFHNEGTFIQLPSEVPYSYTSATSWVWVDGEYECINTTTAKRLLMEEVDYLGNPLDKYKCLEGYRIDYEYLADKLVGEFTEIVTFPCDACRWNACVLQTSMPQTITFNGEGQEKTFTLYSPSEWSITTDSGITVTPSSGTGGGDVDYITIKNNTVPTSEIQSHTIVVNYCNKTDYFYADVVETSPTQCYPLGQYYSIDYNAQELMIPTNCCVTSLSANVVNIKQLQSQKGYIRMWVDANDTGTGRTMTLSVTDCTSATTEMYIYQSSFLSEWKTEQTVCNGRFMCDFQRLYSGLTQDSITAATYVTRWANCSASTECQAQNYKWVESQDTYCDNGKMYYLEYLYIYENGSWRRTSGVRYGNPAEDVSGKCTSHIEHWIQVEGYYCNETTKYNKERLYYEEHYGDPESAWTETNIYRMGTTVIEYNSLDCGYGSDSGYTYQQWRPSGYECMSGNKYTKERKYVSNDTTNWVATDIYRVGIMVEQYSTECGWEPDYEYRWVTSNEEQCGTGDSQYNVYQMYQKERRPIGSVSELDWEPVPNAYSYDADGTEEPILIESGSSRCNAPAPPLIPEYRWVEIGYYCSGTTKYAKEAKQISMDNGATWSYLSPMVYRMGSPIEYHSVDCGYIPQEPIYRWTNSGYTCSGTSGYDKYNLQVYEVSYDNGEIWSAVTPTQTQLGTLIEHNSTDCGYVPPTQPIYRWIQTTDTICVEDETPYSGQYLTFVAEEDGTFGFKPLDDMNTVGYSTDSGSTWSWLGAGTTGITEYTPTISAGTNVLWKGTIFEFNQGIGVFSSTGRFHVEGNAHSLIWGDNFVGQVDLTEKDYAFAKLFSGCTTLTSAENMILPATTLASSCYANMFQGCTNLTTAPQLPATILAERCYYYMFRGCTSLTTAPQLPATTLTQVCYVGMFGNCTSLTTPPVLSATTLGGSCYAEMFAGCTSLTTAPTLPATTLANYCYTYMFYGCSNLNSITCLATDISANGCTQDWVNGVASNGTFTKAASMSSWTTSSNGIPSGWTVQDYQS